MAQRSRALGSSSSVSDQRVSTLYNNCFVYIVLSMLPFTITMDLPGHFDAIQSPPPKKKTHLVIIVTEKTQRNPDVLFSFLILRVRELSTAKIGTIVRISGQVVRTHPVHPELVSGTFVCLDCQTVIKDVEQQFKYTQVGSIEDVDFWNEIS